MRKVETFGSVDENGNLKISYRDKFLLAIKQNLSGSQIKLTAEKKYKKRSTYTFNEETGKKGRGQNGYYIFVICGLFCEGWRDLTGEIIDKSQAHERLKMYCNYKEIAVEKTGEIIKVPQSTADQTSMEANEYHQRCRDWMFENMGVNVPLPNQEMEIEFKDEKDERI